MADSQSTNYSTSSSTSSGGGSYIPNYDQTALLMQIAREAQGLGGQQYSWAQNQIAQNQPITDEAVQNFLSAGQNANALAQNQYDRYTNTYQPLEDSLIRDANTYASDARQRYEMGRAESDAGQAADAGRLNAERQLQSYGIDPSSGKYAELEHAQDAQRAASQVSAATSARQNAEAVGRQLRGQAIQVGQQLPGNMVNALNSMVQANAGAVNSQLAATNTGVNALASANPFLQTASALKYPPLGTNPQNSQSQSNGSGQSTSMSPSPISSSSSPSYRDPTAGYGGGGGGSGGGSGSGSSSGYGSGYNNAYTGSPINWYQPDAQILEPDPSLWGNTTSQGAFPYSSSGDYGSPAFDTTASTNYGGGQGAADYNYDQLPTDWGTGTAGYDPYSGYDTTADYSGGGNYYGGASGGIQSSGGDYFGDSYMNGGASYFGGSDASYGGGYGAADSGYNSDTGAMDWGFAAGGAIPDMMASNPDMAQAMGGYGSPMSQQMQGVLPQAGVPGAGLPLGDATTGGRVPQQASPSMGMNTDDIPANLNAEEFVVPRDVARWKGEEFFQKMIAQARQARLQAQSQASGKPGAPAPGPVRFASQPMGA